MQIEPESFLKAATHNRHTHRLLEQKLSSKVALHPPEVEQHLSMWLLFAAWW